MSTKSDFLVCARFDDFMLSNDLKNAEWVVWVLFPGKEGIQGYIRNLRKMEGL
jgi:hypothetical protein